MIVFQKKHLLLHASFKSEMFGDGLIKLNLWTLYWGLGKVHMMVSLDITYNGLDNTTNLINIPKRPSHGMPTDCTKMIPSYTEPFTSGYQLESDNAIHFGCQKAVASSQAFLAYTGDQSATARVYIMCSLFINNKIYRMMCLAKTILQRFKSYMPFARLGTNVVLLKEMLCPYYAVYGV